MTDRTQPARWYMVDKDGMATLCTDREDAEQEAKDANMAWPHTAPYRAVQLVEVGTAAAELHQLRARDAYAAGMGDPLVMAAPVAQGDAEDAARYRFLAAHCRSTSEHWGGRWSIVVEGPAPESHDSEDDFDAAIDAARSQAKEG